MIGWREDAKNAIYTSYKNELKFNNKGIFETPEGEKAYFKSRFNGESRMVLFFRDKVGKKILILSLSFLFLQFLCIVQRIQNL